MLSLDRQIHLLLITITCGFTLGLFFDFYRTIRWVVKPNKITTYLGDLIYWLLMAGLVFKVLLLISFGEVRLYLFICLALGGYLYFYFFSRFVLKMLQKTVVLLARFVGVIVRLIRMVSAKLRRLIRLITNLLSIPLKFVIGVNRKIYSKSQKVISLIPFPRLPKIKLRRKKIKKEGPYSIGRKRQSEKRSFFDKD
jgi:spore cortex biosynthesis protein YabQ